MTTLTSSAQSHECSKRECFFCYEQNRATLEHVEWKFPSIEPEIITTYSTHVKRHESKWSGCEKLFLMPELRSPMKGLREVLPNRTESALQTQITILRKKVGIKKFGNTFLNL